MAKYHFNKETGRTGKCEAKIKCRLGLAESEHFETADEAKKAYEETMKDKTASPVRKKRAKDIESVRFDATDTDVPPYKQDQNLNGKTVAEYRKFIVDTLDEYSGREKGIRDSIVDKIGVSGLKEGYGLHENVEILTKDEIEIAHHLSGNAFGFENDEYGHEYDSAIINDLYAEDFLDDEYVNNEHYESSNVSVEGYYNDDHQIHVRYRVPEDLQKDAEGVINAEKYKSVAQKAIDPAFPDWAVLPENVTLDEDKKKFENPRFQRRPNYPRGKISILTKDLDPAKERERLIKLSNNTEKNLENTKRRVEAIKEINKSNPGAKKLNYTEFSRYTGDPADLTKNQRDELIERLENKITNNEQLLTNQKQRLDSIRELTPQEEEKAKKGVEELENEYKEKIQQYTVEKLSRNYSSSNENLRKREAEKWVNTHPEILNVEWF